LIKRNDMKNETLEEAAEYNYPNGDIWTEEQSVIRRLAFKNGAKWQAERMFSEEDLQEAFYAHNQSWIDYERWFEQFKKK